MVESKSSEDHQSFQVLRQLNYILPHDLHKLANREKIKLTDESFMHALGVKIQSLCELRKGYGLSANMVGYNTDFFVASSDGINFRYFYELEYTKLGENMQSLEACISDLDENNNPRRFLCSRSNLIQIKGKEVFPNKVAHVDEEVSGIMAAVIQHECENMYYNFITHYGIEVQVS